MCIAGVGGGRRDRFGKDHSAPAVPARGNLSEITPRSGDFFCVYSPLFLVVVVATFYSLGLWVLCCIFVPFILATDPPMIARRVSHSSQCMTSTVLDLSVHFSVQLRKSRGHTGGGTNWGFFLLFIAMWVRGMKQAIVFFLVLAFLRGEGPRVSKGCMI